MKRKIYISDDVICLSEYIHSKDDWDFYTCWNDEETQSGYNHKPAESFDEWKKTVSIASRFTATIIRLSDGTPIGSIFLSSDETLPDLAIMIYKPYRKHGYGTAAFSLGAKYCFDTLMLDVLYAGCYPNNTGSLKMLSKCGFIPHPDGNLREKHCLTGEEITQLDFIKTNPHIVRK